MRLRALTVLFAFTLTISAAPASADSISVGDEVKFLGSYGSLGGGAFRLDNLATGLGEDFLTFCLQMTQHIDYSNTFVVGGITGSADDQPVADPISNETAWIYANFRQGLLGGYSSNEIQAAIWFLEDEWTNNSGNSATLRLLAANAVAGGWTNGGVQVINLFYRDGRRAQDQLTYSDFQIQAEVPEPASALLFASGLAGLAALIRRRKRAAQSAGTSDRTGL